jgi:hypothetical protein
LIKRKKTQNLQKEVNVSMAKTVADNEGTLAASYYHPNIGSVLPTEAENPYATE